MGEALPLAPESARNSVATIRDDFPVIEILREKSRRWFPGLAKRLSRDKAAAAVHHLTGEPERTCYDWCKGAVDPPARALVKLLHSAVGWTVLEYLMRGCKQPWWLEVQRAVACAGAYEQARQQLDLGI